MKLQSVASLGIAVIVLATSSPVAAQLGASPHPSDGEVGSLLLPKFDQEKRRWGFCDLDEQWVIKPMFTERAYFSNGVAVVKTRRGYGILRPDGEVQSLVNVGEMGPFKEELAVARRGERWGYIDKQGEWQIPPTFADAMSFRGGVAFVKSARRQDRERPWGIVDKLGEWRCPPRFVDVSPSIGDGYASANLASEMAPEWHIVDMSGQIVSQRSFSKPPGRFDSGLALVELPGEKPFYVGPDGNRSGPDASKFHALGPFNEGVAPAAIEGDMRFLWGFIDTGGNWVVPAKYLRAGTWGGDRGPVQIQDGWGVVDRAGEMIADAEYAHIAAFGFQAPGIAEVRRTSGEVGYLTTGGRYIRSGTTLWPQEVFTDRYFGLTENALRKKLGASSIETKLLAPDVKYSNPGYEPRNMLVTKRRSETIKYISVSRNGFREHYWLIEASPGEWKVFFSAVIGDGVEF